MKKLFLVLGILFLSPLVRASDSDLYDIFLTSSPTAVFGPTQNVIFNLPDRGVQTCITKLTFQAFNFPAAGTTLKIVSDQTAVYTVNLTTTIPPFIDFWDYQDPLCLTPGVTSYITVSSGTFNLNAVGFARSRRE